MIIGTQGLEVAWWEKELTDKKYKDFKWLKVPLP